MPKPAHTRVTYSGVRGTIAAPMETFAFGINITTDPLLAGFTDIQLNGVATAARTCITGMAGLFQADTIITESRVAVVDGLGKVVKRGNGSFLQGIEAAPVMGAGTNNYMPLQASLVVSLVTARPGPSGKGRVFLPFPAITPSASDKLITGGQATALMDQFRDTIVALNQLTAGVVSVVSSKGYTSAVTGLRVGRAPDTLRSRRRDAKEGYSTRGLAAA